MRDWIVYGSELSPFTLKVLALCRHKGLPYRFLPEQGSWLDNVRVSLRRERLVRRRLPLTYPQMGADDEYPLVPFLFGPDGENLYDSSAIGEWLDRRLPQRPLIPADPALKFLVTLLDEFADEWMLYLVHHFRWKVSAADNDAGARLAREWRTLTLGWRWPVTRGFSARQVRRLPYLFSVAPEGFVVPRLPGARQPPARSGFPPTHALLEESYRRILLALEAALADSPWLFGAAPTLADFSIYGQVGMNLADPSAADFIARTAPRTHAWVQRLHRQALGPAAGAVTADGAGNAGGAAPSWSARMALRPLLAEVCRTYVPLMQQNLAAVERHRAAGEQRFNERAFDAGRCLYDGAIDGTPFRSVAKTFQAQTWRRVVAEWRALEPAQRTALEALLPSHHGLTW